jgi:hypothetical protein
MVAGVATGRLAKPQPVSNGREGSIPSPSAIAHVAYSGQTPPRLPVIAELLLKDFCCRFLS